MNVFLVFYADNNTLARLVNGGEAYGRVEVNYEGTWGTVCHDGWSNAEAKVICRQLGFPDGKHGAKINAWFGQGTGRIQMDELGCSGKENNLNDCYQYGWSTSYGCSHADDAGVYCVRGM